MGVCLLLLSKYFEIILNVKQVKCKLLVTIYKVGNRVTNIYEIPVWKLKKFT